MKPVLFYSKSCDVSIKLWKHLLEKNLLDQFIKICIDNNNKILSIIQTVPAILVKGRPPIVGNAIHMFITSGITKTENPLAGRPNFNKPPEFIKKLDGAPNVKTSTNGLDNIMDFNPVEMSANMSDSYSFIQANPAPLDFCYEFITTDDSGETRTPSKKPSNNLDNRLQDLQAARNELIPR